MANAFTVNLATDDDPTDVRTGTAGSSGNRTGSVRQAINYANTTFGPVTINIFLRL